jgi:hypothetical protein
VTVTTHGSTNFAADLAVAEVSGMATSGQPDVAAQTGTGNGTSASPGQMTTATATDIVFAVMASDSGANPASVTSPSGWTSIFKETDGADYEVGEAVYQITSATGNFNPTWTVPSGPWVAGQVAYKGSGAAAPAAHLLPLLGVGG